MVVGVVLVVGAWLFVTVLNDFLDRSQFERSDD